jgi:general secretion pathway protein D
VIRNEVLLITSEQIRDTDVYQEVYNVADLVIGIPNFVPGSEIGLPAAIRNAHNRVADGMAPGAAGAIPLTIAADTMDRGTGNASMLAQMGATGMIPGVGQTSSRNGVNMGGGGAAMADFDSLIELIQSTIAPDSWEEVGGAGTVSEFRGNLSLVISQTQEVHEEIADLLEQLRRLQDLQVTIEVRFINLRDNFFEQIGIDFDLNIDSNVANNDLPNNDNGRSTTIGLGFDNGGNPTNQTAGPSNPITNLVNGANDIQIRQGSFAAVQPGFGGYAANTATTMGIAILSDLEAYFFVRAVQGDKRTNILQSPKVTLFNGQAASVSDQIQQPFVTSVTPVVGDFAAAQAPVIGKKKTRKK